MHGFTDAFCMGIAVEVLISFWLYQKVKADFVTFSIRIAINGFIEEVFVNHCKTVDFIWNARLFKDFSAHSLQRRFTMPDGSADRIVIVLLFIARKKNAAIFHDDCPGPIPEPSVLFDKKQDPLPYLFSSVHLLKS